MFPQGISAPTIGTVSRGKCPVHPIVGMLPSTGLWCLEAAVLMPWTPPETWEQDTVMLVMVEKTRSPKTSRELCGLGETELPEAKWRQGGAELHSRSRGSLRLEQKQVKEARPVTA